MALWIKKKATSILLLTIAGMTSSMWGQSCLTERGLKSIENYWHGKSKDETHNRDTEIAEIQKMDRIL